MSTINFCFVEIALGLVFNIYRCIKRFKYIFFFLSLSFSSVLSYLASSSSFCCLFNLDPIKSVIFTLFSFDMKQKMMMINSRPIRCLFLSTANPLIINEIVDETKENILFFLLLLISCDKEKKKKDELNYFFVTIKKKKNYYYYERIFYFLFFSCRRCTRVVH